MTTVQSLVLSGRGKFHKDAIALECGDRKVTYGEFDTVTDRLAATLQQKNCGPKSAVLVRMERSTEMVLSMFGVLKSGAAFVPVPLGIPEERFKSIQRSAGAALVIDNETFQSLTAPADESAENPESSAFMETLTLAEGSDPAIILYTSGSTGEPKGVVQNQNSVGLLFQQFPYHLGDTGISPCEFDTVIARLNHGYAGAYHYEYPAALINGKRFVLLKEKDTGSIAETCRILDSGGTFCMTFLPSQLMIFLENERFQKALSKVTCLCFLAEPVSDSLKDLLQQKLGFTGSLITLYGQTECFGIGWQDLQQGKGMTASDQVRVIAINEEGQPSGPDEKGELAVSSPTLFERYLLQDTETADSLFQKKNVQINGERFLRTGDLGTVSANGEIHLAGRNDRMVKYHGQRIELPEIEEVIRKYPGIRNCCLVIAHAGNGTELLAAYYEGENGQSADTEGLRAYLRSRLPAYMVPACLIRLDQIPLNINGKMDFKLLASLPVEQEQNTTSRQLTHIEELIAASVAAILRIEADSILPETNLMALGMDSLNAVRLISSLAEAGYTLTLEEFINSDSLQDLAEKLKRNEKAASGVSKEKKEISNLVPCTDMQTMWARNPLQVVSGTMVFRGIEKEEIERKVEALTRNHPVLRSSFIEDGGKILTKVLKSRPLRWEYADLRKIDDGSGQMSPKQERYLAIQFDQLRARPDLSDLLYIHVIRIAQNRTILLLRVDHRVADGMSERIILNELLSEEPFTQTDNYVAYLDYTGEDKNRKAALAFWKEYLKGTTIPQVPQNPQRTGNPQYKQYHLAPGREQTDRILAFCQLHAVSLSAFVLCQYGRAMMEILGLSDMVLPVAVSGRSLDVEDMDQVVGCIVNAVPVRIRQKDTEKDFMRSCLLADRYSFLNAADLYKGVFGLPQVPDLLPFVVSEIFPDTIIKEKYETLGKVSYDLFDRGDFLWADEKGIHLMLHPDIDHWDEKTMDQIIARTEKLLFIERNQ